MIKLELCKNNLEITLKCFTREIDAKKTPRGKERFIRAQKDGLRFIDRNRTALYMAIASHITLGNAKEYFITKDESDTKYRHIF